MDQGELEFQRELAVNYLEAMKFLTPTCCMPHYADWFGNTFYGTPRAFDQ